MKLERDFFVALVTATVENNFPEVQSLLTEYALKNDGMNAEEIISQFKDGNKRSILHFAAQSQPKESGDDDTDTAIAAALLTQAPAIIDETAANANAVRIMRDSGKFTGAQARRMAGGYLSYLAAPILAGVAGNTVGNMLD